MLLRPSDFTPQTGHKPFAETQVLHFGRLCRVQNLGLCEVPTAGDGTPPRLPHTSLVTNPKLVCLQCRCPRTMGTALPAWPLS